ncbi:5'/3'-nucleotidase SurE [Magnetofaba australis]|uniref:5'-nucleotidase SurE n=1 Tax=Magnetofaba australis IT-1 TaxID=1434232 RepID=A0A1Y2K489_9PROT|nr:5'/3'-nucleotidase SurE [Magnetofaba australis]OSM01855.1 putative 5'-nucleotidase [Magnetofaba australis IT-1]
MLILLTNDDGIQAAGLQALYAALAPQAQVVAVAPEQNMSGVGHGLTRSGSLRVTRLSEWQVSVDGTPSDCVQVALRQLLRQPPDLVISGINLGPNVAEDVTYSGTVGGAWEGALAGIPAMAVSVDGRRDPWHFDGALRMTQMFLSQWRDHPLPAGCFLNINAPNSPLHMIKRPVATRQGRRGGPWTTTKPLVEGGAPPFWSLDDAADAGELPPDFLMLEQGYVSVSVLNADMTHGPAAQRMRQWIAFQ